MKDYPAKPKKRKPKTVENAFDPSVLTPSDKALLEAFELRQQTIQQEMADSNIIYTQKVCSGCGYPTFDEEDLYETCVLCLWEGWGDTNLTYQGPPNYIALMAHRINIGYALQALEEHYIIEPSIHAIIQSIERFKQGTTPVDRDSFEQNAKNILPLIAKTS